MEVTLLDTVAIAGYLDPGDAFHESANREVRAAVAAGVLIASAVSYAELLTGVRLGHHGDRDVRGFFRDLVHETAPVGVEVAERAAEIRGEHRSLRMPDALIIATAEVYPADRILAGDGRWAKLTDLGCELELLKPGGR